MSCCECFPDSGSRKSSTKVDPLICSGGRRVFRFFCAQTCCELRCDSATIPGRSSGSDSQHRCPEHRVVATLCRDSPDKSAPWGSGGRGFKSRRPDWVRNPLARTHSPPYGRSQRGISRSRCAASRQARSTAACRAAPGVAPVARRPVTESDAEVARLWTLETVIRTSAAAC